MRSNTRQSKSLRSLEATTSNALAIAVISPVAVRDFEHALRGVFNSGHTTSNSCADDDGTETKLSRCCRQFQDFVSNRKDQVA